SAVSRRTSAPTSKSSRCTRTAMASASGDRREKGDLARADDAGRGPDVALIDRSPDHVGALEGGGILRPTRLHPGDEVCDGLDMRRQLDLLLGTPDFFANPCEVEQLDCRSAGLASGHRVRLTRHPRWPAA